MTIFDNRMRPGQGIQGGMMRSALELSEGSIEGLSGFVQASVVAFEVQRR